MHYLHTTGMGGNLKQLNNPESCSPNSYADWVFSLCQRILWEGKNCLYSPRNVALPIRASTSQGKPLINKMQANQQKNQKKPTNGQHVIQHNKTPPQPPCPLCPSHFAFPVMINAYSLPWPVITEAMNC
ncbi:hypothetical protein [Iodobacter ciconiae]|uniref:Uncharacterized protein n=1 Tax=Iodobacter ciconiae TaxID=2496266 RepID=A0A3S8ZQB0_9NEIS|nr:hypothetical protein [Iodobacter ciconiae]AZN35657.1 hypothetical protein EJO50_03640 [Iodobacter ciconiae]